MKTYLVLERDYTVPGNIVRREEVSVSNAAEKKALFVECVLTPVSPTEPLHVIHVGSVPVKS